MQNKRRPAKSKIKLRQSHVLKTGNINMTNEQRSIIRLYYANTSTRELADMIGCSYSHTRHEANAMGLKKNKSYMRQVQIENAALMRHAARKSNFIKTRSKSNFYEDFNEIAKRWLAGETAKTIALEYGMLEHTVLRALNRHGIKKNKKN